MSSTSEMYEEWKKYSVEDHLDTKLGWYPSELQDTKVDGYTITCHFRPFAKQYKQNLGRTEMLFENCTVAELARSFQDHYDMDKALLQYKKVEVNEAEKSFTHYCLYKTPIYFPFMHKRDLLLKISLDEEVTGDGSTFICFQDIEHPDFPLPKRTKRVSYFMAATMTQVGDNVALKGFDHNDMKNTVLNMVVEEDIIGEFKYIMDRMKQNRAGPPKHVTTAEAYADWKKCAVEDVKDKKKWKTTLLQDKKEDGFTVTCYERPFDKKFKQILVSTDAVFENCTIAEFAPALQDHFERDKALLKYEKVPVSDEENSLAHYVCYKSPFPLMYHRDLVMKITIDENVTGDGSTFILLQDIQHPDFPLPPKTLRVNYSMSIKLTQDGENMILKSFDHNDMKNTVLNMFCEVAVVDEFKYILAQMKENREKE